MLKLLVACLLVPVVARIPSRLNHGLGGRLQGAGVHGSKRIQPRGMEDLSWWQPEFAVAPEGETPIFVPTARSRKVAAKRGVSSASDQELDCLLTLSFATCLGGLSALASDENHRRRVQVVYSNGEPTAMIAGLV